MIPINLQEKLSLIDKYWTPGVIAQVNDFHVKLAKIKGEFPLHRHAETDELFLVIEGNLRLILPDCTIVLREGDLFVVPAGIAHQPVAENECSILLIEPAGTVNTGDVLNDYTTTPEWL